MRYFIVCYDSDNAQGFFEFPAPKYPPKSWLYKQIVAVLKREGVEAGQVSLTNIIELTQEDYESWIS